MDPCGMDATPHSSPGPSTALVAWRRFLVETLLCVELVVVIPIVGLGTPHDLIAGLAVGSLVAAVLRIIWHSDTFDRRHR